MDSTPVNWEALDSLVVDFAKSENLVEDLPSAAASPPPSPSTASSTSSSSVYQSRLLIRRIRMALELGEVDAAIDLIHQHAPAVLDDHRLLFRLQKQKFIELLRKGTASDRDSAIECLRVAVAPCALDAYPEAYEEFKHILLALIYDKKDQTSPVANEWSERRRFDIAGLLSSVLRAHLHAYDPVFSMTLRYLISIHKVFCLRQGIASPISDLTERLLFEDRDLPGLPQEVLYEAPPFDEVDIQALAHAVELTRQGAVDSLRFAKGNLYQAFQNELCHMQLDVSMLDKLVHEYCIYRGLVGGHTSDVQISSNCSKSHHRHSAESASGDSLSLNIDCGTGRLSDSETSVNNVIDMEFAHSTYDANMQGNENEVRFLHEGMNNSEDCSTSNVNQTTSCRRWRRLRSHGAGQHSRHKRWKGRTERLVFTPDVLLKENNKEHMHANIGADGATLEDDQASLGHSSVEHVDDKDNKYATVLGLRELASKGMAAEVVEEINTMDPNFFKQNPVLLFHLKQVEFLKHVGDGDHGKALRVACSYLGPLAAANSELMKPLKETLFTLLKPNDAMAKSIPLPALATSLQIALGRRLGIEEPQLMKIMRATIHSHNEWFKLQMCKDHFEGILKIDCLKAVDATLFIDCTSRTVMDNCTHGSQFSVLSNKLPEDGSSPASVPSGDVICNENAILKVMEFLALPRADAIHLLVQYNGNAETVIQQSFA